MIISVDIQTQKTKAKLHTYSFLHSNHYDLAFRCVDNEMPMICSLILAPYLSIFDIKKRENEKCRNCFLSSFCDQ